MEPQTQSPAPKVRTIDSMKTFLIATAVLGPFALPLLWRNPRFKWSTKVAGSVAVLVFTWALLHFAGGVMKGQLEQLEQLKEQLEQARQLQ